MPLMHVRQKTRILSRRRFDQKAEKTAREHQVDKEDQEVHHWRMHRVGVHKVRLRRGGAVAAVVGRLGHAHGGKSADWLRSATAPAVVPPDRPRTWSLSPPLLPRLIFSSALLALIQRLSMASVGEPLRRRTAREAPCKLRSNFSPRAAMPPARPRSRTWSLAALAHLANFVVQITGAVLVYLVQVPGMRQVYEHNVDAKRLLPLMGLGMQGTAAMISLAVLLTRETDTFSPLIVLSAL